MGLLGLWVAQSPRHWFLRMGCLACPIALLAAVPAYELVLIFLGESASIALPFVGLRMWAARRFHFRLADLLLAIVVVAAGVLLAKNMPHWVRQIGNWTTGVALGYAVLAGYGVATVTRNRWLAAGGIVAGLALAGAAAAYFSWMFLWDAPPWFWFAALSSVTLVVWGCLALHRMVAAASGPRRAVARLALGVLVLSLVPLPAVAYYQMAHPMPVPLGESPTPNAYVELTRIGKDLNENNPADFQQQLSDAAHVLAYDSWVPVKYVPTDVHLAPHAELRALLRFWTADGEAAEADGRYDEACKTYLNIIRAGEKTCQGGLLVQWLLSSLYLQHGLTGLQRIRWQLSDSRRCEACAELRFAERTLEPLEAPVEREQAYMENVYGWQTRIHFLPIVDIDTVLLKQTENRYRAQMRLLEVDLAVRCFQNEHDRLPDRLDELLPDTLPAVPIDPFTGQPLIYRRTENVFLLYSTGPDKIDDGGARPLSETPEAGEDLLLKPPS